MEISKLEGIKLLSELNMPTVKLLDIRQILEGKEPLKEGISVRLSPKSKLVKWNVGLPSINRRTNLDEISEFVEQYQNQYIVFAHKSVIPESIGTLSKLEDCLAIETYKSYEDKHDEIIDNRIIVPMLGDKMHISRMEMLREDEQDFKNFRKVLMHLKGIPFSQYEMEYVIENGDVVFMDFTVANNREYQAYKELNEGR